MGAHVIDGKARAASLRADVRDAVTGEVAAAGRAPGLAVVLIGDDPASQVYVRNKGKAAVECGFAPTEIRRPADVSEDEVVAIVQNLNADSAVDGILVQLPLPDHINARRVIESIDPAKDVDGLTFTNAGRLALGEPAHTPCTPQGSMLLIKDAIGDVSGARAVVVGRSILVGKPMGALLLDAHATPTIAHSRTKDLAGLCREADILVAAVGRPHFIPGDWVKPGACVIDVGINRVPAPDKGEGATKLVGDVDFAAASAIAGAITPVPGGVGPMTIACLMANAYRAWCMATGRPILV